MWCTYCVTMQSKQQAPKKKKSERNNTRLPRHSAKWICLEDKTHRRTNFYNSIFHKSKIPFENLLILMYGFIHDFSYSDIQRVTLSNREMSSSTIAYYHNMFREILYDVTQNINNDVGLIGSEKGSIVEVDESLIGSRKYNRGRYKNSKWLIGMIERGSNNVRFEYVATRDKETLLAVLKKYVHKNATIITDCWKGYINLDTYFYRHQTVNHSENFISPITGAHTQSIENQWHLIKRRMRVKQTNTSENAKLTYCLCLYVLAGTQFLPLNELSDQLI